MSEIGEYLKAINDNIFTVIILLLIIISIILIIVNGIKFLIKKIKIKKKNDITRKN